MGEGSCALIVEGEPGIGKTALWGAACDRAERLGYRVLWCRPAEAEAKLSYSALTDLLGAVGDPASLGLSAPQCRALDAALLRVDPRGPAVDRRAVSAAVASVLVTWASERPLVVAIDDVQWLDGPSARVLAFALRRLGSSTAGILAAVRSDHAADDPLGLGRELPRERVERLRLGPLRLGALRHMLSVRLGLHPSRPVLLRIERASGGNPLYALELAASVGRAGVDGWAEPPLPEHLRQLVASRIDCLPVRARAALVAVAALARPSLAVLERAGCRQGELERAETQGLIEIRDGEARFTHPLFASAVYESASGPERRRLHRRLAAAVAEPEEQARHLALGADRVDARVAIAVERAARRARARGAPDAAAELLERALVLTPTGHAAARRRRTLAAAEDYLYSGDRGRARVMLEALSSELPPSTLRADALLLLAELSFYDDSWPVAVRLLKEALALAGADPGRRARAKLDLCYTCFNVGDVVGAHGHAAGLLDDAMASGCDALVAQALATGASMDVVLGQRVDEDVLERALALEDCEARTVLPLRPSWSVAQVLLLTGQLTPAHQLLAKLRADLVARGLESDLPGCAWLSALTACLRGDLVEASVLAEEAVRGSLELESRTARMLALSARALASAYRGLVDGARADAEEACLIAQEIGWAFGVAAPLSVLGFLALSLGEPAEAHRLLGPLGEQVAAMGLGEPMVALFLGDEIEALVALGDFDQAERLLALLDQRGRALDRPWALATAARCRGLLLAARGDLDGAARTLERALTEHARLEMPFELGRMRLASGQIARRLRQKRAAKEALEQARQTFEAIGAPLWSAKASAEIDRLGLRRPASDRSAGRLTETEERVAALASTGLKNREIAAQLFISPKTVQVNLGKVYEKLGIHSRAELGARVARADAPQT